MKNSIISFPKQFEWDPKIENADKFSPGKKFIHAGMGGSQLASDILKQLKPELEVISHRSYGLPKLKESDLRERLVIVNSYSGNTEETISSLDEALAKNLSVIAISTGGTLLQMAKERQIPYIEMPALGVQPRMSTGIGLRALAKAFSDEDLLRESVSLSKWLIPSQYENLGKELAQKIRGRIPIVYASDDNFALAKIWKIKFNESGKIPAFWNVLPELNHNEMTGFSAFIAGISEEGKNLSDKFHFIFLRDSADHERIKIRFDVLNKLFQSNGMPVTALELQGESELQKVFSSLLLADWTCLHNAEQYGLDPEEIPLVEEFKLLIQK